MCGIITPNVILWINRMVSHMREAFIRETKRRLLSLLHSISYRTERKRIRALLMSYDPSVCEDRHPESVRTVAFVITRMVRFHGGQTSILHLGTELAGMQDVVYLVYKPQSEKEMDFCAGQNLPGYKGRVRGFDAYLADVSAGKERRPDIVVATSWDTVSVSKRITGTYHMYFVQDYEPYFYGYGEQYLMCRSTYEQGLHMVSLGPWNKRIIERECKPVSEISVVDFPCALADYPHMERDYAAYRDKKEITLAVYLKYYGKRLPNFIPWMLNNTAAGLAMHGIRLNVMTFGEAGTFRTDCGVNLGQLNREELCGLYHSADFGLVASMSNISLVPYEMHAAGLPVIEFADGTYTDFLPEDTALLTDMKHSDITEIILDALAEPEKLQRMNEKALEAMKELSWQHTAKQFYSLMQNICDK